MRRRLRRNSRDAGNGELDDKLFRAWEAAAEAVGKTLDLSAGKDALMASSGQLQPREEGADLAALGGTSGAASPLRRRQALRWVAGMSAVLAAGAVIMVAAVLPGAPSHGNAPLVDTAYVVERVSTALRAAGPGDVAQVTVTTRSAVASGGETGTTTAEQWSYGDQWRSVTDSSAAHPIFDEGFSAASVYTLVNYQAQTWARQPGPGSRAAPTPRLRSCTPAGLALFQLGPPGLGLSASSLPAASALRMAISCGALAVAGRQDVDGMEAIELTSRPGSRIPETIWVSPESYLPVRVVVRSAPGQPVRQRTADITWLPPTAQNLAYLAVPVPAGFTKVPFGKAARSASQQTPGPGHCPAPAC